MTNIAFSYTVLNDFATLARRHCNTGVDFVALATFPLEEQEALRMDGPETIQDWLYSAEIAFPGSATQCLGLDFPREGRVGHIRFKLEPRDSSPVAAYWALSFSRQDLLEQCRMASETLELGLTTGAWPNAYVTEVSKAADDAVHAAADFLFRTRGA